ncbi:sequestosome-1 [Zootermopsis nevadensis]|uniref:Sequestosome-1 n=1 Tax=Zootermopsis nevadensis TaxID=136037 RepID=A0A067RF16_ZOONE|nr:sequestosome-1 [Zootermopsis nevadensis]XP_021921422.1 sequestosome-1 [Zootermopsis nevadensis]XP_021921423.1 sequestosome-1 [Zootermopsis nevadensis]KDR18673.1 Sequestosome-1 [Zootermopsis nevadensis]
MNMAQENTVSFKVFLQDEHESEVRRFGVDRNVVANFNYLKEKLQAVFPSLRGRVFIVAWKDADGDEIIISSDDELIIALTESQTEVRKLYVTPHARSAEQHEHFFQGLHQHVGVACDVCEKAVQGFRYKCIQCPDFDLCATCESKSHHPEHCMIRIPVPTSWRPHFGRRLAHHLAKSAHKSGWEPEAGHCPWRPHGGRRHGGRHHGVAPGWLEALASYFNEWTNLSGEEEPPVNDNSAGPSSSKQHKQQEQQEDAHIQYLRNIGQTVASVLDPLGIDVDIEVRTRNKDEKAGDAKNKTDNTKDGKNNVSGEEQTNAMEVDEKHQKEASASAPRAERESTESEGWTVVNQDATQQGIATPNPSAVAGAGAETATAPQHLATASSSTYNSAPVSSGNMYPSVFALPNHAPLPPMQPPLLPQPVQMPLPASSLFVPPQAFIQHSPAARPHIADAVEKMMSMGFSNEGGWLTQLLESKNGNIEKVLDVLQPVKKI